MEMPRGIEAEDKQDFVSMWTKGRGELYLLLLTCQSTIDLEHAFHVRFGALKCIQIAHKDARVNRLRILRVRLVGQF